jgi:hypothetical protein
MTCFKSGGNQNMKKKMAIITVELVEESIIGKNEEIAKELMDWFREDAVSVPWVKDIKGVAVREQ